MSENGKKTVYTACCLCYQSCGVEVTVEDGKVTAVKGQESHPCNTRRKGSSSASPSR